MRELVKIAKALADENRTRVLMFLRGGEMCVCQVIEMLGLAPSTVSRHLEILHQAGLIESRKEGRWVYYRLSKKASACARKALGWLEGSLACDRQILDDTRHLKTVLKMDREKLCCRYKK